MVVVIVPLTRHGNGWVAENKQPAQGTSTRALGGMACVALDM
jgi:hypothetical protein